MAQKVKEKYCYVSKDIAKEFEMHERNPKEYVIRMEGIRAKRICRGKRTWGTRDF